MNKLNNAIKSCVNKDKTNEKESSEKSEVEKKSENDNSVFDRKSTIECKGNSYETNNNKCDYNGYSHDNEYDYNQDEEYSDCLSDFDNWLK